MQVYVTGARGFVGRRLCAALAERGDSVVGVDRDVDVTDAEGVADSLGEAAPDAVIHLAALSFVPGSWDAPASAYRVNFLGTRSVLEAVRCRAPRARLLVVSSGHVYGTAPGGASRFDETAPLRPGSPYAWSKAAADRLAAAYAAGGLDVVRARPFNHTGPGRPDHFVESSLARQLVERDLSLRDGPLEVGNLDAIRDFLDVDDVIRAYLGLLDPAVPAGVYNVASGRGQTIRELLDTLAAKVGLRPELSVEKSRWRPTDVSVGNAERLRRVTGWEPTVRLEETLERLVESWREQLCAA